MRAPYRLVLVGTFVLSACKGDTTAPPKPARISVSVTTTIIGTVNAPVVPSPTFTVVDDKGSPMSKVSVTVSVGTGGGSVTNVAKESAGVPIPVGAWVLGPTPGLNTLTITVAGLPQVVITADGRPAYFVDLRFFGAPVDPVFQAAFQAAKTRIESVITADVIDANVIALDVATPAPAGCGVTGVAALTERIDDVVIFATVDSIDGPGKVLGSSGPCYVRTPGGLSLVGVMRFDIADFQNLKNDGRLNDVVLHEMLHVVGIGTLWSSRGQISGAGTPNSAFIGLQAVAGCQFHGGTAPNQCGAGTVPLETTGGPGTRDVHWREVTTATGIGFRTELMTGFVSAVGTPNPLSRMSIGSLADIGYEVNLSAADSYTVPSSAAASAQLRSLSPRDSAFQIGETVRLPIASVDGTGRVTTFSRRPQ